eukprot:scaffold141301_cov30-Tisochrysis_lutea.AAC.2
MPARSMPFLRALNFSIGEARTSLRLDSSMAAAHASVQVRPSSITRDSLPEPPAQAAAALAALKCEWHLAIAAKCDSRTGASIFHGSDDAALPLERVCHASQLGRDRLTRQVERVRLDGILGERRPVRSPRCVHQVGLDQGKRLRQCGAPFARARDGHEGRINTHRAGKLGSLPSEPVLDIGDARLVHSHEHPLRSRQLLLGLHKVAPVGPEQRVRRRDERGPGRAGESCEPLAALVLARDVLGGVGVA